MRDLWFQHTNSVVACGIDFSHQGLNAGPLHWRAESQPLATREVPPKSLLIFVITVRLKICWVISPVINLLLGFAKFSLLLPSHINFSHLCLVRLHLDIHWNNNKRKLFECLSHPFLRVNTCLSLSLACSASFSGKSGWIHWWLALT